MKKQELTSARRWQLRRFHNKGWLVSTATRLEQMYNECPETLTSFEKPKIYQLLNDVKALLAQWDGANDLSKDTYLTRLEEGGD